MSAMKSEREEALVVLFREAREALAASEARERMLQRELRDLIGNLMNWSIDLETGKKKTIVAHSIRAAASRISRALPDAPAPETGETR